VTNELWWTVFTNQSFRPNLHPDAESGSVEEFKVLTTPFSAEYGHTGGGVMIVSFQVGTNTVHGSMYDFFRNRLLNDRNVFQTTKSTAKYVQNDPGSHWAAGGESSTTAAQDVLLRRFNVTLASNGNLYSQLVPTAAEEVGDFSQTFSRRKARDHLEPGPRGRRLGQYDLRPTHSPGNRIPVGRLDRSGVAIAKSFQTPMESSKVVELLGAAVANTPDCSG